MLKPIFTIPVKNITNFRQWLLIALSISLPNIAFSAGTAAGTQVENQVEVSYQIGADPNARYIDRAAHTFTVSELIRSNVSTLEPQGIGSATPATNVALSFQLTNTGNGTEPFLLTASGGLPGQFIPSVTGLWIETNGLPGWQSDDTVYLPSSGGVSLDADQSEIVYVVSNVPSGLADEQRSDVTLISTSGTQQASSKLIGQSIDGMGDGGIEAVVAQNNARHQDSSHLIISTVKLDVEKTILSIKDPYGTDLFMPGSEVTYKIRLVASGNGTAKNLVIDDVVPVSMHYKSHTLTVNGNPVSDNADGDIGHYDSTNKIAYFSPGTIVAPATHEYTLIYIID